MSASEYHKSAAGVAYHTRRRHSRSEETQQRRSRQFQDLEGADLVILDFGCGTGGVLSGLTARERIGVEISETAAAEAGRVLDRVYSSLSSVDPESIDVIISCHALEHVEEPAQALSEMRRIAKPGARVRVVVPMETSLVMPSHRRWRGDDPDMHLYSWTPLSLGNLFTVCGFKVTDSWVAPVSDGGRLGRLFRPGSFGRSVAAYRKALRSGQFETCVTAVRP